MDKPVLKWLLGQNNEGMSFYMEDFKWEGGWYWAGGYIQGYRNGKWTSHTHFKGLVRYDWYDAVKECYQHEDCNLFDGFMKLIPVPAFKEETIWRLCDLMKQFDSYKDAAQCFRHGGHYCENHTEKEINPEMEKVLNVHIETVIIPEVRRLFEKVNNENTSV